MGKQRENKNAGNRGDNAKTLKVLVYLNFHTLCASVHVN